MPSFSTRQCLFASQFHLAITVRHYRFISVGLMAVGSCGPRHRSFRKPGLCDSNRGCRGPRGGLRWFAWTIRSRSHGRLIYAVCMPSRASTTLLWDDHCHRVLHRLHCTASSSGSSLRDFNTTLEKVFRCYRISYTLDESEDVAYSKTAVSNDCHEQEGSRRGKGLWD